MPKKWNEPIPTAAEAQADAMRLYGEIVREIGLLLPFDVDPQSERYNALGKKIGEYGTAQFWIGCGHVDPEQR